MPAKWMISPRKSSRSHAKQRGIASLAIAALHKDLGLDDDWDVQQILATCLSCLSFVLACSSMFASQRSCDPSEGTKVATCSIPCS